MAAQFAGTSRKCARHPEDAKADPDCHVTLMMPVVEIKFDGSEFPEKSPRICVRSQDMLAQLCTRTSPS
jgi:hypothetical protein